MLEQHQDSLLPRVTQGEGHETTGKRPYLVRINRVLHVVNIHTPDPESPVRNPAERTDTGRLRQAWLTNPAVTQQPGGGRKPAFLGMMWFWH